MKYADIAAYPESSLAANIHRLFSDPQFMALMKKARGLPKLFHKENITSLFHWMKTFSSIDEFQAMMYRLIAFNIRTTSDGLWTTGFNTLSKGRPRLFLSNHRSIALDTAYLNFALASHGLSTIYSAAGDNLMKIHWVQHLIRLNKGFVVKRNVQGMEAKLAEARRLSSYIHELLEEGNSVWIAHRGGRAKNGDDRTDSAVLNMLAMSGAHDGYEAWSHAVEILPMAISWEQLPQDEALAKEVAGELDTPTTRRDLLNIVGEINGNKGRVHLAFGRRVTGSRRKEMARTLDREIQSNYRLWDANWLAYIRTRSVEPADRRLVLNHIDNKRGERILSRAASLTPAAAAAFMDMYARPVENALSHHGSVASLLADQAERFAGAALVMSRSPQDHLL